MPLLYHSSRVKTPSKANDHGDHGRNPHSSQGDVVSGRVSGHAKGYGFVIPDDGSEDLFLHQRRMRKVLHGDRVLARPIRIDSRGRCEGAIVEVIVDAPREIVGCFYRESGINFVVPDDSRFARDIAIANADCNGAQHGDVVVARIIHHPREDDNFNGEAVGEIAEVVGNPAQPGIETDIAIRKHGIPTKWSAKIDAQLNAMHDELQNAAGDKASLEKQHRRDLRKLPLVTIDGEDARDFDDAVYAERLNTGDTGGDGWRLVTAIADVSHYVAPATSLDLEAHKRGNSVYFPCQVVAMLPAQLSNGICSLNPGEDRYCMVCDVTLDARGEISAYQFYAAIMHSHARLTYTQVDNLLSGENPPSDNLSPAVTDSLHNLQALTDLLLAGRNARGTIDFEFPEAQLEFDDRQKIRAITTRRRNRAHRLIEECMLVANRCAAEHLQKHYDGGAIYRNHFGPSGESLSELRRILNGLGLTLGGGNQPTAADYAQLVGQVSSRADIAPLVQLILLRSLSQAEYAVESAGHFALAYPIYTHFTSPIRRYSDLIVHRQIRATLTETQSSQPPKSSQHSFSPDVEQLKKIAAQCSMTERRADDATRDVLVRLKAAFMADKVGEEFAGVVCAVTEFGLFVQLDEFFVDGLVHVSTLGNDYYQFDAARFALCGERSGRRFGLGDKLRVVVVRAGVDDGKIDFELAESGDVAPSNQTGKMHKSKRKGKHGAKKKRTKR